MYKVFARQIEPEAQDSSIYVDFEQNAAEGFIIDGGRNYSSFTNEEYDIIENTIGKYVPKVKRKAYSNWTFVSDLTNHGRGYSIAICKALGVDPYGHI